MRSKTCLPGQVESASVSAGAYIWPTDTDSKLLFISPNGLWKALLKARLIL